MHHHRFVVTGCARSGTKYMSRLLSAADIRCSHERVFKVERLKQIDHPADYFVDRPEVAGDASWCAAPFLNHLPDGTVVLHQVRNPIDVIRSLTGIRAYAEPFQPSPYLAYNHPEYLEFEKKHCPDIFAVQGEIEKCMRYWILWNRMVQSAERKDGLTYFRYRLEDVNVALLNTIIDVLAFDVDIRRLEHAFSVVSQSTNSRPRDASINWESLPPGEEKHAVAQLARQYGYSPPAPVPGAAAYAIQHD